MQESDFLEKYKNSETVRRGVELILKSPDYTNEYKELILNFLGDSYGTIPMGTTTGDLNTDSLLHGSISILPTPFTSGSVTISTKGPGARGYLEKPKYIDDELVKAIDVTVTELIKPRAKDKPNVVLTSIYDDLTVVYNGEISDHQATKEALAAIRADLEAKLAEISSLLVTVDSEKLLRASAENDSDMTNERYVSLLTDFQTALQKGIKDAIERVSLEAQVQGLTAQVKVLTDQMVILNNIVKALQIQVEAEQARQAASEVLDGVTGTYDQKTNTGWKLPQTQIRNDQHVLYIETENDNKVKYIQGTAINFYNFNEDTPAVFHLSTAGDATKWLDVPNTITVPRRDGSAAGKGYVTLRWKPKTDDRGGLFGGNRNRTYEGSILVTTSFGESHLIKAAYKREVDRRDTWSPRGIVGTTIGAEKD